MSWQIVSDHLRDFGIIVCCPAKILLTNNTNIGARLAFTIEHICWSNAKTGKCAFRDGAIKVNSFSLDSIRSSMQGNVQND